MNTFSLLFLDIKTKRRQYGKRKKIKDSEEEEAEKMFS